MQKDKFQEKFGGKHKCWEDHNGRCYVCGKDMLAIKFGSAGGKSKSPKKMKASRLNGRLGGRPKTKK